MTAPRAVLFDIDGTLIDSNMLHVRAWIEAFGEQGLAPGEAAIHGQIGKGGDHLVPTLAPSLDKAAQQHVADRHGAIFKERFLDETRAFADAHALLARVHAAGARVVLASSAKREELAHHLATLDAAALVDDSVTIDDVASSKPAPDIFATAVGKLRPIRATEIVAVGDTPYDIDAAAKVGVRTIGLRSGGFADEDLGGAVAIYDDVAALLADYDGSPLAP